VSLFRAQLKPGRLTAFCDSVFAVLITVLALDLRPPEFPTLCLFGGAAAVALKYPLLGPAICCCCLIAYLKPDAPGSGTQA
jgi:hypothetical protein